MPNLKTITFLVSLPKFCLVPNIPQFSPTNNGVLASLSVVLNSKSLASLNQNSIVKLFQGNSEIDQCVIDTQNPNLKIIPGSIKLAEIEIDVKTPNLNRLKTALDTLKNKFDFIIIDCSPSLGYLTLNSFVASDSILIPVQCEFYALDGLRKLLSTIKSIKKSYNQNLNIEGILMTMYDKRLSHNNHVISELKRHFKGLIFKTIIKRNVSLSEAPSFGTSVFNYKINCEGATNYLNLSQEIMNKKTSIKQSSLGKKYLKF